MTAFSEQPWDTRFKAMGDEAEQQFEHAADTLGVGWARYGLRRPQLCVGDLPAMLRYTPDYLTVEWGLVEVQGSGRDQIVKLKAEKLAALEQWAQLWHVNMFLWDSTTQQWAVESLTKFDRQQADRGGFFDETKPWYGFNLDRFEWHGPVQAS